MVKKVLVGCSALLVLGAVGIAVLLALNWDRSGVDASDIATDSLGQDIEREFGGQPDVAFLCLLPVVGAAPCILKGETGSREVTVTFRNYEVPEGTVLEDLARRIAVRSFEISEFVRQSDHTQVVFEIAGRDESVATSQISKYSFDRGDLAAAAVSQAARDGEEAGDGEASDE